MKKLCIIILLAVSGTVYAADYMTPEEIDRIWGDSEATEMRQTGISIHPKTRIGIRMDRPGNICDIIDEYAQAAAFIQGMQYLEPDTNFGGIMEGEHLPDIIQTDNTSESVWIWCRYYQLTSDNQYYQNILNSWQYMTNWPAWREEGGNSPLFGYYRYYVGGWGLLAEMIYRDTYSSDTFRVHADSIADYMVENYLVINNQNAMVYAWAMGCLYLYGIDVNNQDYITYADTTSAMIKAWVDEDPGTRLNFERWAMSGGAFAWGLDQSYFTVHPEERFDWFTANAIYLTVLDSIGDWHLAHSAWYAIGQWTAFDATGDSMYFYNHAFLTDTLLAEDGDNDGGIPAEFGDTDDMDQSWCTAYLGFMCLNPLLTPPTPVDEPQENMPTDYIVISNYPNPFNSQTTIRYSGFDKGMLTAEVYNLLGRQVNTIYDGPTEGSGAISWNPVDLASGVYFLRLSSGGLNGTIRMAFIK